MTALVVALVGGGGTSRDSCQARIEGLCCVVASVEAAIVASVVVVMAAAVALLHRGAKRLCCTTGEVHRQSCRAAKIPYGIVDGVTAAAAALLP